MSKEKEEEEEVSCIGSIMHEVSDCSGEIRTKHTERVRILMLPENNFRLFA